MRKIAQNVYLSIICSTFNHVKYIRKALDSFLIQKTNFIYEILIHDDASTDGTTDILREYELKYPNIIRCVYEKENQWMKKDPWKDILFPMVQGKYVALCDGDDYWLDPFKLQKQVNFLDKNLDYSICFHPVKVYWEDRHLTSYIYPNLKKICGTNFVLKDLLKSNFIQTNSVVYRWRFNSETLSIIPSGVIPEDWMLHLLHAEIGKIFMMNDIMSVYRRHKNGIWTGAYKSKKWFLNYGIQNIKFYLFLQQRYKKNYSVILNDLFYQLYYLYNCDSRNSEINTLCSLYKPNIITLKKLNIKLVYYYFFAFITLFLVEKPLNKIKKIKLKKFFLKTFDAK